MLEWKQLFLLTNIIIETSITSANKHNFTVEHLFKNKLSSHDFWLADNTQLRM
jgi:hypothetical protein